MTGNSDEVDVEPVGVFGIPKGRQPRGRSGPNLRGEKGHWMGPMVEVKSALVPLGKLNAIYDLIKGQSLQPGYYFFHYLIRDLSRFTEEISEIREFMEDITRKLSTLTNSIQDLQEWKDASINADISFVGTNLARALSLPLPQARDHAHLVYSNTDHALHKLINLTEMSLGTLEHSDHQRIPLLDKLVTLARYQTMLLLLMGYVDEARDNLNTTRAKIEHAAAGLLADWTDGVDLQQAAADRDHLGRLLDNMEVIDGKAPTDRLLDAYQAVPRLPTYPRIIECIVINETGPSATPERLALVNRTLPVLDGSRGHVYVLCGQIFDQYIDHTGNKVVVIPEDGGYLIEWDGEYRRHHRLLAVRALKRPIGDLAHLIERLALVVESVRNMAEEANFAADHPELAHELARACLGKPESENGIILRIPKAIAEE